MEDGAQFFPRRAIFFHGDRDEAAGVRGSRHIPVAPRAITDQTESVTRPVLTILAWLAVNSALGAGDGGPRAGPAESIGGRPQSGRNFTVAGPAIAMIWVAPGTFVMSSTHGAGDDTVVTLTRGYWLGQTEITQAQWQAVVPTVPAPSLFKGSDRPVENVDLDLMTVFCRNLNESERLAGRLPAGCEYALPTEAQWEYACRAGTTGSFAGEVTAMAWYEANSNDETHPVAQKQPNAWGFYDMHGNVQEWCADWYAGYPGGRVTDPTGGTLEQFRVRRGGAFNGSAGTCRSAYRSWGAPSVGYGNVGFRLALAPLRNPLAAGQPAEGGR